MKRILVIAQYFPPVANSASVRAKSYLIGLARLGIIVDLITFDHGIYPDEDDSLLTNDEIPDTLNIYRVSSKKKKESTPSAHQPTSIKRPRKKVFRNMLKKFFYDFIAIPDGMWQWRKAAVYRGKQLLKLHKYDLIFSMHEGPSSHLVAKKIHNRSEIRWITYWGDPWLDDPKKANANLARRNYPVRRQIEGFLEKSVVKHSYKLLFTSPETSNYYQRKYSLNPLALDVVFRGYDKDDILSYSQNGVFLDDDLIRITYAGIIHYPMRDVFPLVEALDELKAKHRKLYDRLEFTFVGKIDDQKTVNALETHTNIILCGVVSFNEAQMLLARSDIALLLGNKNSSQIPGKVYEYLGFSNITWTILGDSNDPLKPFMERVNKGPVDLNTALDIKNTLLNIAEMQFEKSETWKQPKVEFEWEAVISDLAHKMELL